MNELTFADLKHKSAYNWIHFKTKGHQSKSTPMSPRKQCAASDDTVNFTICPVEQSHAPMEPQKSERSTPVLGIAASQEPDKAMDLPLAQSAILDHGNQIQEQPMPQDQLSQMIVSVTGAVDEPMGDSFDPQAMDLSRTRGVLKAVKLQKQMAKRAFHPKNVQELQRAYRMHIKAAREIRSALKKIGASIKCDWQSSSDEDAAAI